MAEIFVHERCELLGALLGDAKSFGGVARGGKSAGDFDWHASIVARSVDWIWDCNFGGGRDA